MAAWSKVLPLTVNCLSPLSEFESRLGQVRELLVTLGTPVSSTTNNCLIKTKSQYGIRSDELPKFQIPYLSIYLRVLIIVVFSE